MAKGNSINTQIFYALMVSEKSRVPMLFMSAPGMGKSTSVVQFAEVAGYKLEQIRGNSTSEDEINGYDVVGKSGDKEAIHLRPKWFANVLANAEAGQRTLLFIDEITTCPDQIQSALLHVIFDRKVHDEYLPEDTLIVSAGNYSQSLGNSFGLIPPLMNRFCIYNIIPDPTDLEAFLSQYTPAGPVNFKKLYVEMGKTSRVNLSEETLNRVGMYIESGILRTTASLIKNKKADIAVTETQNIYGDVKGDEALCGFVTPRTLCYLRDASIAAYLCFGIDGIKSNSNYRKIIEGLCGYGLVRKEKSGEVETTRLTEEYFKNMNLIAADLEKMDNAKISEYEDTFNKLVGVKKIADINFEDIIILNNKFQELAVDKSVSGIERPIDEHLVPKICEVLKKKIQIPRQLVVGTGTTISEALNSSRPICSIEVFSGAVSKWNQMVKTLSSFGKILENPDRKYSSDTLSLLKKIKEAFRTEYTNFSGYARQIELKSNEEEKAAFELVPKISTEYYK